jgi:acyl-CoA dehydrogenase
MQFELDEDHRMLRDLVQRFVREEVIPLEGAVLARDAAGQGAYLTAEEKTRLDRVSKEMGLWSLDAPEELGGLALPHVALVAVNEALRDAPEQVNQAPYGDGWLFRLRVAEPAALAGLLDAAGYTALVEAEG